LRSRDEPCESGASRFSGNQRAISDDSIGKKPHRRYGRLVGDCQDIVRAMFEQRPSGRRNFTSCKARHECRKASIGSRRLSLSDGSEHAVGQKWFDNDQSWP
jgi:hypothetical protein